MAPSALQVCEDCARGLLGLGAVLDPSVLEITAGRVCDAHPTSLPVQATRGVFAHGETFQQWVADARSRLSSFAPAPMSSSNPDFGTIAMLAGQLLTGQSTATDIEIEAAVGTARRILAATKGGGR